MKAEGLNPVFPMSDISVMGISEVAARLPLLLRRIGTTVKAAVAEKPDCVLLIDSQDFSKRVASGIRKQAPEIPIVLWVSPTVWAWRPGRAAAMKPAIDHILAVLPFEPEVHEKLGGPPCTYVGHPLASEFADRPANPPPLPQNPEDPVKLLLLPGSRLSEIGRHLPLYKTALEMLAGDGFHFETTVPAVHHVESAIRDHVADWQIPVRIISQDGKTEAFQTHHGALATSGTVTLELALHGVPMIGVYLTDRIARLFRGLVKTWTILLPNFIAGRPFVREFVDEIARPEILARQLKMILTDTPERRALLEGCQDVRRAIIPDDPSAVGTERAVDIVLETIREKKKGG